MLGMFSLIAMLAVVVGVAGSAHAEVTLTDLKGRSVTLQKPASRLLVDDGRLIIALSFLSDDPVSLVAAWPHDIDRFGRELYATYLAKFPAIGTLPKSTSNVQDMAVEQVMAARPDLVVLSLHSRPAEQQLAQLDEAGIPVIFVDFSVDPFVNSDKSLDILGKAIGRDERAKKVVAFRQQQKRMLTDRISKAGALQKPVVFMETHASTDEACCNSPGSGNVGRFIDFAGGANIGAVLKGRPSGQISLEYALAAKPDVYIASGGQYMEKRGGLLVGPNYGSAQTQASLDRLLARPGFSSLPAIEKGNIHGISQQLFNSPLDLLALELIARWVHPDLFADIDVEVVRKELSGFMAVPLTGAYWTK
ncbi:ABC transporter substrate-binding protein [Rhizobium sp. NPDC090275]|uniref:ABC transporter substrate-binding protein n=1 Tax=Rhizobium sp. NPDC090275 TaxID=3364498 RepID=UPI00383B73BE